MTVRPMTSLLSPFCLRPSILLRLLAHATLLGRFPNTLSPINTRCQKPHTHCRKPFLISISIAMPSPCLALPALFLRFLFLFPFSSAHSFHFHDDAQSLLAFKKLITSDPNNSLANWSPTVPLCNWTAITCGGRHPDRVVAIDLDGMDLRGTISPSLGNLSFLRSLNLSENELHGHIPPQLGRLFRLRWLWLYSNQLEGNIPHQLSSCRNLVSLDLSDNNLSGIIPDFCRFKNGALIPRQSQELRTISLFSQKFQCPVQWTFFHSSLKWMLFSIDVFHCSLKWKVLGSSSIKDEALLWVQETIP